MILKLSLGSWHINLSNLGKDTLDVENNLSKRSWISTPEGYSSTGSKGSDSPDYNSDGRREFYQGTQPSQETIQKTWMSTLFYKSKR